MVKNPIIYFLLIQCTSWMQVQTLTMHKVSYAFVRPFICFFIYDTPHVKQMLQ